MSKLTSIDKQAMLLKVAAMLVAAPRYVGLMLFLSGFVFQGQLLGALHIAEGVAGLALAVLEGFALAFILSRRQLGFSSLDKRLIFAVVAVLLLLLPIVATPYLLFLFDGSRLFATEQAGAIASIFKFAWAAATASMPILIIVGVALVEKDPVDAQLVVAERQALLQQRLAEIEAETEQKVLQFKLLAQQARAEHKHDMETLKQTSQQKSNKAEQDDQQPEQAPVLDFSCEQCGAAFGSIKAVAGHKAHCKAEANGKLAEIAEVNGNGR